MRFRESIPRSCHCTILRTSPPVRRVEFQASRFPENRGVGIVELCGSLLNPSPCLMAILGKDGDFLEQA